MQLVSVLLTVCLSSLSAFANDTCAVDKLCYMNEFTPNQFPWKAGDCLNYEEVFKNFSYFEVKTDCKAKSLIALKYQQGKEVSRTEYLINSNKLEAKKK